MFVPYLLRDGEADDVVSLRDVPCHHSRVRFHRLDGHIDRRRQAICKHRETNASFNTCAVRQMRRLSPANPKHKWRCEVNKQLLGVPPQKPQTLSASRQSLIVVSGAKSQKVEADLKQIQIAESRQKNVALWSIFNAALKSWKNHLKARVRAELVF